MATIPTTQPKAATLTVTYYYYHDLVCAMALYVTVVSFTLAIDASCSKIYKAAGAAHIGLLDESRGSHSAADTIRLFGKVRLQIAHFAS